MQIAGMVISLILLILKEYFDYKKRERSGENQAKLEIADFKKIIDAAVVRLIASYKKENNQIGSVEDQMDQERERAGEQNSTINNVIDSLKPNILDIDKGGKTPQGITDEQYEMFVKRRGAPTEEEINKIKSIYTGKISNDEREIYFIDDIFDNDLYRGFSTFPETGAICIMTKNHPSSSVAIKSEFAINYFFTRKDDHNKERGIP